MTKLNRLAIAAGVASALGALAAAGKGVNDALGGRPSGARLARIQRSPAYTAGGTASLVPRISRRGRQGSSADWLIRAA